MDINLKKVFIVGVLLAFLANTFGPMPLAKADEFRLPAPGVMVHLSPPLNPPILKGIKVHPDNPFRFDFILDKGDVGNADLRSLQDESIKLIKYFLASLTIPEKDLWVNLSPYEKNRIIPQSFGLTEMGRDLLAEDYMLKQITASLIYPEDEIGKKFWKRIYEEAAKKFGTTNIPVNTFNKVWIVPEKAVVYENAKAGTAYVVESKLKVMLEEDYLALEKHTKSTVILRSEATKDHKMSYDSSALRPQNDISALGSQIIRQIVIPALTKEVNQDKNFSQLRQVYNSLILATWYKKKIKDSILEQVYADENKVAGVGIDDPQEKEKIYQRYLQAFKRGVYNYIKEDQDLLTRQTIPRKYFSGGMDLNFAMTTLGLKPALSFVETSDSVTEREGLVQLDVRLADVPKEVTPNVGERFGSSIELDEGVLNKYLPLIMKISGRWSRKYAQDDANVYLMEGYDALKDALKKMPEFDSKFPALVVRIMQRKIINTLRDEGFYSRTDVQRRKKIDGARADIKREEGDSDDLLAVSNRTGLTPEQIMASDLLIPPKSLDSLVESGSTDKLEDGHAYGKNVLLQILKSERTHQLMRFLKRFKSDRPPPKRDLDLWVVKRTLDPDHPTQKQIAAQLEVSEGRISQRYTAGLMRLKRLMVVLLKEDRAAEMLAHWAKDYQERIPIISADKFHSITIDLKLPAERARKILQMNDMEIEDSKVELRQRELLKIYDAQKRKITSAQATKLLNMVPGYEGVKEGLVRSDIAKSPYLINHVNKAGEGEPINDATIKRDELILEILDSQKTPISIPQLLELVRKKPSFEDVTESAIRWSIEHNRNIKGHKKLNVEKYLSSEERDLIRAKLLEILNRQKNKISSRELINQFKNIPGFEGVSDRVIFHIIYATSFLNNHEYLARKESAVPKQVMKRIAKVVGASRAMIAQHRYGGIDFTANKTPLEIQNAGQGIKFHLNPAMLAQLRNAPGFVPVIISIQPLKSLADFLGISH